MKNQDSKFYKLKKVLYGLKQVPRAWNKTINGFLKKFGFKKYVSKHGVYVKKDTNEGVIILFLYVDNLLITDNNEECIYKFKSGLMKEFEIIDLGLMTYFIGIEFYKSKKGVLIHQRRHALEIFKKFEMEHCNDAITPDEPML